MVHDGSSAHLASQQQQGIGADHWVQGTNGIFLPRMPRSVHHLPPSGDPPQTGTAISGLLDATDREVWKRYWAERGHPWRREPEIPQARQEELEHRLGIQASWEQGIYPFGGMTLNRADIEWLLATHERERGPIDPDDERQRTCNGLDLRGAKVEEQEFLCNLPLVNLCQGLDNVEVTEEHWEQAHLDFSRCNLSHANLSNAQLFYANLSNTQLFSTNLSNTQLFCANLSEADLSHANLSEADLSHANLSNTQLFSTNLSNAQLFYVNLSNAHLFEVNLSNVQFSHANLSKVVFPQANLSNTDLFCANLSNSHLSYASLSEAILSHANLSNASLIKANLSNADLFNANLNNADLPEVNLSNANLSHANLSEVDLSHANLSGADLSHANLSGADLSYANLSNANLSHANLNEVQLTNTTFANVDGIGPFLVDVKWRETSLTVAERAWSRVCLLGDEAQARQAKTPNGEKKGHNVRHQEYQDAHRANHQLAVVLQEQGLIDHAARFAYRAKCLRRKALWHELFQEDSKKRWGSVIGSWLFSWILFLLAGYGYRLRWCLFWPVGLVALFALFYWMIDPVQMPWWMALGESVNVFHGRGAAPTLNNLAHPVWFTFLSIAEALIGLIIETVFIATVLQRLFGK